MKFEANLDYMKPCLKRERNNYYRNLALKKKKRKKKKSGTIYFDIMFV